MEYSGPFIYGISPSLRHVQVQFACGEQFHEAFILAGDPANLFSFFAYILLVSLVCSHSHPVKPLKTIYFSIFIFCILICSSIVDCLKP